MLQCPVDLKVFTDYEEQWYNEIKLIELLVLCLYHIHSEDE